MRRTYGDLQGLAVKRGKHEKLLLPPKCALGQICHNIAFDNWLPGMA
jgi:hypothetical protein